MPGSGGGCSQQQQQPPSDINFSGMGILQAACGTRWQAGNLGQTGTKADTDTSAGIYCPAIGIQNQAKTAAAQLEPGQQHRGARNKRQQGDDNQQPLPPVHGHQAAEGGGKGGTYGTNGQTYGGKNTGELGDIKRCRRLARFDIVGNYCQQLFVLAAGQFLNLGADYI